MCGILAVLNLENEPVDQALVVRMRDTMYHRGPDDAGLYAAGPVALAHRRLAIIDLSPSGRQPLANEDDSLFLIFNGEIYNYVEQRQDLKARGHTFSSASDGEVILHLYEEHGHDCVAHLNGMFAFVLWDRKRRHLFAARDRLGIKPLYVYTDGKRLILASEIKAILEDPTVPREPDPEAIADYLFAGRPLAGKTFFKHVRELEPGHLLSVDVPAGGIRTRKFWDVVYDYNFSRTLTQTKEELSHLLDDAVRVHCRSDAPLGCHLSGGLDSSTVVALAARHRHPLPAFSIKFSGDDAIDETPYARAAAQHVGASYLQGSPTAIDLERLLPFLVWQMDGPMANQGGFCYFTVSALAQRHVKVTLTGHGGDEVFAGYPAQFRAAYGRTDVFGWRPAPGSTLRLLRRRLRSVLAGQIAGRLARRLRQGLFGGHPSLEDLWIQLHCGSLPTLDPGFARSLNGYSPRDDYVSPFGQVPTAHVLDKCLYHDLRVYLPSLLHLEDRASMALSIESRVPLLDHRIVEFMATVPPEQKVHGLQPKYLLRQAASNLLPPEVWQRRDKQPFPLPRSFNASAALRALERKVLLSPESFKRGIARPQALREACAEEGASWGLLNLELWFKIFIDRDPYWMEKSHHSYATPLHGRTSSPVPAF